MDYDSEVTQHFRNLIAKASHLIAFLDSSALLSVAPNGSNEKFQQLRDEILSNKLRIFTGEIVIQECVNKFRERFEKASENYLKSSAELQKLIGQNILFGESSFDQTTHVQRYSEQLRSLFDNAQSGILPFPPVDHATVAQWAMTGKKPYNKGSKDGYRDTLVWFTLVELLQLFPREEINFVTANYTDFSASKEAQNLLHSDLLSYLRMIGANGSQISVISSLNLVIETLNQAFQADLEKELEIPEPALGIEPTLLWDQITGILDSHISDSGFPTDDLIGINSEVLDELDFTEIIPVNATVIEVERLAIGDIRVILKVITRGSIAFELHVDDVPSDLDSVFCDEEGWCFGTHSFQKPLELSLIMNSDKWISSAAVRWNSTNDFEVIMDQ